MLPLLREKQYRGMVIGTEDSGFAIWQLFSEGWECGAVVCFGGGVGAGGGGGAATAAETYQNSSHILAQSPDLPAD